MTIFSAHFAFSPQLGLIKFPHLYLHSEGVVDRIESCGEEFIEVHSAQFFSGLLLPGFIVDLRHRSINFNDGSELRKLVLDNYFAGAQYFILPASVPDSVIVELPMGPQIVRNDALPLLPKMEGSPWAFVKQYSISSQEAFVDALRLFYGQQWSFVSKAFGGGDFLPGMKPGVLCVSGIDWKSGQLMSEATLKRLL